MTDINTTPLVDVMLVLLIGQPGLIWPRSSRGSVQEASAPFRRYVQTGFDLLAYRLERTVFASGDTLDLTLYWRAVRPIHDNFQITVSLVDANNGLRTVQSYRRHIGGYPTSRWPRDRYIRDSHQFQIPPSLMPGTYLLVVELWQCEVASPGVCQTARRLAFFDERGAPEVRVRLERPVALDGAELSRRVRDGGDRDLARVRKLHRLHKQFVTVLVVESWKQEENACTDFVGA